MSKKQQRTIISAQKQTSLAIPARNAIRLMNIDQFSKCLLFVKLCDRMGGMRVAGLYQNATMKYNDVYTYIHMTLAISLHGCNKYTSGHCNLYAPFCHVVRHNGWHECDGGWTLCGARTHDVDSSSARFYISSIRK